MRLILKGTDLTLQSVLDAYNEALNVIEKESPDLFAEVNKATDITATDITVDFSYELPGYDDRVTLTAEHNGKEELLTFIFEQDDNHAMQLKKYNNDDSGQSSMFTDEERAIIDAAKGFEPVKEKLDITGCRVIHTVTSNMVTAKVFDNGYVKYYNKEGNCIQEATVNPDELTEFIKFLDDNLKE